MRNEKKACFAGLERHDHQLANGSWSSLRSGFFARAIIMIFRTALSFLSETPARLQKKW
jgi:hypothetical protein